MEFINLFIKWQKKKYSQAQKLLINILAIGTFWFIIYPALLLFLSEKIEQQVPPSKLLAPPINVYLGILISALGITLLIWIIWVFYKVGQGTPAPIIPSQKLITNGPFAHSRNPMVVGVILWVVGFGTIINSVVFITIGLIIPFLYLFIYIKIVEEKELAVRFGRQYLKYKKKVPFLIPTFTKIDQS